MAMVEENAHRRVAIETALAAELGRQNVNLSLIDLAQLAQAVDLALDPPAPHGEGKRPSELNSANDD